MSGDQANRHKHFFAVASIGKGRWYWVVWPSLATIDAGEAGEHLADGYEPTKAGAVDQALAVAGWKGEWLAAKFASQYHRQIVARQGSRASAGGSTAATMIEFLYRDLWDETTELWYSVPHRIVKKTPKYVYVEQDRYEPAARTGSWLDYQDRTFRLDRHMLEAEGYALAPISELDDPLFFTIPYQERFPAALYGQIDCLTKLDLTYPCTAADVKAAYRRLAKAAHPDQGGGHEEFLVLRAAYEQALRLCGDETMDHHN